MRRGTSALGLGIAALFVFASPAAAQNRAEYAAQVNPICAEANADAAGISAKIGKRKFRSARQAAGLFSRLDQILDRQNQALLAVPPPPVDLQLTNNWLEYTVDATALLAKQGKAYAAVLRASAAPRPNVAKVKRLGRRVKQLGKRIDDVAAAADSLGSQLGAFECSSDS